MGLLDSPIRVSKRRITQPAFDRAAVVDIGSNSVRLVVYEVTGASLLPRYNEKVTAGLGRGLRDTNRLSPDGVIRALNALKRFAALAEAMGVAPVAAFATAAIRSADDGPDFIRSVRREAGIEVDVLDGAAEAFGSAGGVRAGFRDVCGLVGDLGGSSLELVSVDGEVGKGETHLAGPLALWREAGFSAKPVRADIRSMFASSCYRNAGYETFYAVGGSWRALAKVQMEMDGYPLRLLHGYRMSAKQVSSLARLLSDPKNPVHQKAEQASERRAPLLSYAAVLLDEVMAHAGCSEMRVSAYGLREGRVFGARSTMLNNRNILIDGVQVTARLTHRQIDFARALYRFLMPVVSGLPPVFDRAETDILILEAATRIADLGATLHPDSRPDLVYDLVLHGPFAGVDHAERAFLALAGASRYYRKFEPPIAHEALMTTEQIDRARLVGALMRLGAVFSGRTAEVLRAASLKMSSGKLVLETGSRNAKMVSELVERRLAQAARMLDIEAEVKTD